jgi:hypothetical protein
MTEQLHYHKDGSLWAKGEVENGLQQGYWEWFRKNGVRMRSGHFRDGEAVGEWITYDAKGEVYKVTRAAESAGDLPKNIGQPATRALKAAGYTTLQEIAALSDSELLDLHGVGPKAVRLLREAITKNVSP